MIVDNYTLAAFKRCPRYYYFRHECNLVPKAIALAPQFGIAIHAALEAFYRGKGVTEAVKAFVAAYAPTWKDAGGVEADARRTPEVGAEIVVAYCERFANDPFRTYKDCVEVGFALELSENVVYCGRIDRIATVPPKLYVVDWKTTSAPWMFVERPNAQFTGYVWACRELLGEDVRDAVVDLIKTTPASQKAQREGVEKWGVERKVVTFSPEEVEEWKCEARWWCGQIGGCARIGEWPKNTESCFMYNKRCEYIELCNTHGEMRDRIVEEQFEVNEWKPYDDVACA